MEPKPAPNPRPSSQEQSMQTSPQVTSWYEPESKRYRMGVPFLLNNSQSPKFSESILGSEPADKNHSQNPTIKQIPMPQRQTREVLRRPGNVNVKIFLDSPQEAILPSSPKNSVMKQRMSSPASVATVKLPQNEHDTMVDVHSASDLTPRSVMTAIHTTGQGSFLDRAVGGSSVSAQLERAGPPPAPLVNIMSQFERENSDDQTRKLPSSRFLFDLRSNDDSFTRDRPHRREHDQETDGDVLRARGSIKRGNTNPEPVFACFPDCDCPREAVERGRTWSQPSKCSGGGDGIAGSAVTVVNAILNDASAIQTVPPKESTKLDSPIDNIKSKVGIKSGQVERGHTIDSQYHQDACGGSDSKADPNKIGDDTIKGHGIRLNNLCCSIRTHQVGDTEGSRLDGTVRTPEHERRRENSSCIGREDNFHASDIKNWCEDIDPTSNKRRAVTKVCKTRDDEGKQDSDSGRMGGGGGGGGRSCRSRSSRNRNVDMDQRKHESKNGTMNHNEGQKHEGVIESTDKRSGGKGREVRESNPLFSDAKEEDGLLAIKPGSENPANSESAGDGGCRKSNGSGKSAADNPAATAEEEEAEEADEDNDDNDDDEDEDEEEEGEDDEDDEDDEEDDDNNNSNERAMGEWGTCGRGKGLKRDGGVDTGKRSVAVCDSRVGMEKKDEDCESRGGGWGCGGCERKEDGAGMVVVYEKEGGMRRKRRRRRLENRRFPCSICGFVFGMRSNLKRHVVTVHEERRMFGCEICGSWFGLKQNLVTHVQVKHEGRRPFECDVCGLRFGYKQVLRNHVRNIHKRTTASP